MKALAKHLLSRLNLHVSRAHYPYIDPLLDIRRLPRAREVRQILDVGANVGQFALRARRVFPDARIDAFEPVPGTYRELMRNCKGPNIIAHELALGSERHEATLVVQSNSQLNSLVYNRSARGAEFDQLVRVERADRFCADHGIDEVDLLKIDTEGYELQVLEGAASLLSARRVHFVYCEAGFYSLHSDFFQVFEYLSARGYVLYGVYEQANAGRPTLEYFNCLFVSPSAVRLPLRLSRRFVGARSFPLDGLEVELTD